MKSLHITVSNAEFYEALREDAEEELTNWTVNRHCRPGNTMLLYICSPISAIVAVATVSDLPELNDGPSSPWFGQWMVDMEALRMLKEPISRQALLTTFPDWGYWRQPRNSIAVPEMHVDELERLLK